MLEYDKHQRHLITVFSVIPLLLSFLGLVNWILRATTSFAGLGYLSASAFSTMLSLFIISVLVMLRGYYKNLRWGLIDYLLLGIIIIYSVCHLLSVFWASVSNPESLILDKTHSPAQNLLAPMAPFTAINLIFMSISYMILYAPVFQTATKRRFSGYFSLLVFIGVCLVFISHFSQTQMTPAMGLVPMPMLTAISFFCLTLALLESVDLGMLRVLHYVSGNIRDKKKPLNQLNAFIFLFIICIAISTIVLTLQAEKRSIKQNLREQLLLNLDAHKNALNLWIASHYKTIEEAISDPRLTQGLVELYRGNSLNENAQFAHYWVQITKKQYRNIRIAIYDPYSGVQKSFGEEIYFSPRELQQIRANVNSAQNIWVKSDFSAFPNKPRYLEAGYLRFWGHLSDKERDFLLLLELQPEAYLNSVLSQIMSNSQINHNHIFGCDDKMLHFITEPENSNQDCICYHVRHLINARIAEEGIDLAQPIYAETYSRKGSVVYFAAEKINYVPWLMVQSIDSIYSTKDLAKWSWLVSGIAALLFLGLAYYMHHSSRRKAILDDQTAVQEWQNTFNAVPSAIWLMDAQGYIQRINNAVKQLFDINETELAGKHYQDIVPDLPCQLDSELLQKGLEMRSEFGHNKRWYESSIAPIISSGNKAQGFVQITNDITEKKENIHRLKASEIRFRAIFDQSPIGISIVSSDLLFLSTNSSFIRIFGYDEQELLGFKLSKTAHPDFRQQMETGIQNLLAGKSKYFRLETRFFRKDGSEIWGLLICILISDPSLEGDFVLAMVENIQDRVQAMQELYRAKEMAIMSEQLKSSFMQNISHEFRTPLNGILGFSQVLKTGQIASEEVKDYADSIYQSGKRMQQLIENIISFAKLDSGQEKLTNSPFSLQQMLNKIYDLYKGRAMSKNLELVCDLAPEYAESVLVTDESKIIQILAKLMDNAIAFTERGRVECRASLDMNILVLQVKDTGIGIPEAKLNQIFERFYQADMSFTRTHDGAGLGLSICKGLANILNGDISVSSELNVGTTFTVKIPVMQNAQDT